MFHCSSSFSQFQLLHNWMWKQYVILSAGMEFKNIRKLRDGITFSARLCYLFIWVWPHHWANVTWRSRVLTAEAWRHPPQSLLSRQLLYLDLLSSHRIRGFRDWCVLFPLGMEGEGWEGDSIVWVSDSKCGQEQLACASLKLCFEQRSCRKRESKGKDTVNPKLAELLQAFWLVWLIWPSQSVFLGFDLISKVIQCFSSAWNTCNEPYWVHSKMKVLH